MISLALVQITVFAVALFFFLICLGAKACFEKILYASVAVCLFVLLFISMGGAF